MSQSVISPAPNITVRAEDDRDQGDYTVHIYLKNDGSEAVELRDAAIIFLFPIPVNNVDFTATHSEVSWAATEVHNRPVGDQSQVTVKELFPNGDWVETKLQPGETISLSFYQVSLDVPFDKEAIENSAGIYPAGSITGNGAMTIKAPAKPDHIEVDTVTAKVTGPINSVFSETKEIPVPWGGQNTQDNLILGWYKVSPHRIDNVIFNTKPVELTEEKPSDTVELSYYVKGLGNLDVDVSGLPDGITVNVTFDDSPYNKSFPMRNGPNSVQLPQGIYQVTASSYRDGDFVWIAETPDSVIVTQLSSTNITYTQRTIKVL